MKKIALSALLFLGLAAPTHSQALSFSTMGNMATLTATLTGTVSLLRKGEPGTCTVACALFVIASGTLSSVRGLYNSYKEHQKNKDKITIQRQG